jgi:short-subunit dehydrogenase
MTTIEDIFKNRISGKNIAITGGTTGIGRATAILLSGLGANIIIVGQRQQHLEDALDDITANAKGTVHGILADVATKEGVNRIFNEVKGNFKSLDILINNAALPYGSVTEGEFEEWKQIVDTNLVGYLGCAGEAIKQMKEQKYGHIVNIGSMSADVQEESSSVYVATKSGIRGFSVSLRKQVNPMGVKVTLIEPGAVDTDMQAEVQKRKSKM